MVVCFSWNLQNPRFFRDDAQKAAELRPFDLAADEMQRGFDVFFAHVEDCLLYTSDAADEILPV